MSYRHCLLIVLETEKSKIKPPSSVERLLHVSLRGRGRRTELGPTPCIKPVPRGSLPGPAASGGPHLRVQSLWISWISEGTRSDLPAPEPWAQPPSELLRPCTPHLGPHSPVLQRLGKARTPLTWGAGTVAGQHLGGGGLGAPWMNAWIEKVRKGHRRWPLGPPDPAICEEELVWLVVWGLGVPEPGAALGEGLLLTPTWRGRPQWESRRASHRGPVGPPSRPPRGPIFKHRIWS